MIRNLIKNFKIYRFNPEIHTKPYYETFKIDTSQCGLTVLDGLIKIKNEIDSHLHLDDLVERVFVVVVLRILME